MSFNPEFHAQGQVDYSNPITGEVSDSGCPGKFRPLDTGLEKLNQYADQVDVAIPSDNQNGTNDVTKEDQPTTAETEEAGQLDDKPQTNGDIDQDGAENEVQVQIEAGVSTDLELEAKPGDVIDGVKGEAKEEALKVGAQVGEIEVEQKEIDVDVNLEGAEQVEIKPEDQGAAVGVELRKKDDGEDPATKKVKRRSFLESLHLPKFDFPPGRKHHNIGTQTPTTEKEREKEMKKGKVLKEKKPKKSKEKHKDKKSKKHDEPKAQSDKDKPDEKVEKEDEEPKVEDDSKEEIEMEVAAGGEVEIKGGEIDVKVPDVDVSKEDQDTSKEEGEVKLESPDLEWDLEKEIRLVEQEFAKIDDFIADDTIGEEDKPEEEPKEEIEVRPSTPEPPPEEPPALPEKDVEVKPQEPVKVVVSTEVQSIPVPVKVKTKPTKPTKPKKPKPKKTVIETGIVRTLSDPSTSDEPGTPTTPEPMEVNVFQEVSVVTPSMPDEPVEKPSPEAKVERPSTPDMQIEKPSTPEEPEEKSWTLEVPIETPSTLEVPDEKLSEELPEKPQTPELEVKTLTFMEPDEKPATLEVPEVEEISLPVVEPYEKPSAPEEPDVILPTGDVDVILPTGDVEVITPTGDVDIVTPRADVEVVTPAADVEVVTPAADVEVVTPTADVEVVTPAADVEVVTPAADVEVVTPSADVEIITPTPDAVKVPEVEPIEIPAPPEIGEVTEVPKEITIDETPSQSVEVTTPEPIKGDVHVTVVPGVKPVRVKSKPKDHKTVIETGIIAGAADVTPATEIVMEKRASVSSASSSDKDHDTSKEIIVEGEVQKPVKKKKPKVEKEKQKKEKKEKVKKEKDKEEGKEKKEISFGIHIRKGKDKEKKEKVKPEKKKEKEKDKEKPAKVKVTKEKEKEEVVKVTKEKEEDKDEKEGERVVEIETVDVVHVLPAVEIVQVEVEKPEKKRKHPKEKTEKEPKKKEKKHDDEEKQKKKKKEKKSDDEEEKKEKKSDDEEEKKEKKSDDEEKKKHDDEEKKKKKKEKKHAEEEKQKAKKRKDKDKDEAKEEDDDSKRKKEEKEDKSPKKKKEHSKPWILKHKGKKKKDEGQISGDITVTPPAVDIHGELETTKSDVDTTKSEGDTTELRLLSTSTISSEGDHLPSDGDSSRPLSQVSEPEGGDKPHPASPTSPVGGGDASITVTTTKPEIDICPISPVSTTSDDSVLLPATQHITAEELKKPEEKKTHKFRTFPRSSTPKKPKRKDHGHRKRRSLDAEDVTSYIVEGSMPIHLPEPAAKHHKVVVAIDFGTTFSGYAYSFTNEVDVIHIMRKWEGGDPGVTNMKTPTTLLLHPDGRFHSFGFSARDFYHDLDHNDAKKWLYFDKFKMTLHSSQDLNSKTELVAVNGKRLPAIEIFAYALKFFKEHALQELNDQLEEKIKNEDIRWVITVPAIWRQPAKQFMREAAYKAGISSKTHPEQILIALEPEAASIYIRKMRLHEIIPETDDNNRFTRYRSGCRLSTGPINVDFMHGTKYMVVDCGGGTVDITVHELEEHLGTLKELHKAAGGEYGSVSVDNAFEQLLVDMFTTEFIEEFKIKRPAGWVDLMIAFEARKRNASPWKNNPLNVSLPFSFIDYYKKYTKNNTIENAVKKFNHKDIKWSSQGMLRFTPEAMRSLFQPTLDHICGEIELVLKKPNLDKVNYLFLVGGFAESPLLQDEVRKAFGNNLRVIIPQDVGLTILKGAVLYGIDPNVVRVRRSPLTYGVGVLNKFIRGKHPEEKLIIKEDIEWVSDIFDEFVIADQPIAVGETVMRSYTPAKPNQKSTVINMYCSDKQRAAFITDEGVKKCGTLHIDLSETTYMQMPRRREIQVSMQFGDTEIRVSALDIITGKEVKANIDFLRK